MPTSRPQTAPVGRARACVLSCIAGGLLGVGAGGPGVTSRASADQVVNPGDGPIVYAPREGFLSLRTGAVRVSELPDLLGGELPQDQPAVVLVLRGPLSDDVRARLLAAGVPTGASVPAWEGVGAVLADTRGVTSAALRETGLVASAHRFEASWKAPGDFLAGAKGRDFARDDRRELSERGLIASSLWLMFSADANDAAARIERELGGRVVARGQSAGMPRLDVILPEASVPALVQEPALAWAEHAPEFSMRSNRVARWVVQSNILNQDTLHNRGLTGAGQVLGLLDTRMDPNHCAFVDGVNPIGDTHRKILRYNASIATPSTHGTHVACTAVGDSGPVQSNTRGMAPDAKVVFNLEPVFGVGLITDNFELHRTQGAFVHSNSWGNDFTNDYDTASASLDAFAHAHEDQLLVFAVSNGSLVTNPENAKNVLAVAGASNSPNQDATCIGGNGPTLDGRSKPEVTAPGCSIQSAVPSVCSTTTLTGTSMATPAVAGLALLVRQYFTQGWYPSGAANPSDAFTPSGALIRAVVINGAVDMIAVPTAVQNTWPNFDEGWGRVLGDNALYFAGETGRVLVRDVRNTSDGALATGGVASFPVEVLSSSQDMKVTLVWTDPPAAPFAGVTLINNLNLEVVRPDGVVLQGNSFAAGYSFPGPVDNVNTVEQVLAFLPQPGAWTIRVVGAGVTQGTQGFALVVQGAVQEGVTQPSCDSVDFNNDSVFPDDADIADFLLVLGGAVCATCNDVDFNNDGVFPDDADVATFLFVLGGGSC